MQNERTVSARCAANAIETAAAAFPMSRCLTSLVALGIGGMLQAQSPPLPRAPGARVVTVSAAPGPWSEPGIALDPHDRARIVAVFQGPATGAYSTDSGRTFT